MSTTTAATPAAPSKPHLQLPPPSLELVAVEPPVEEAAPDPDYGVRLWSIGFGIPFVLGFFFYGLTIATDAEWVLGPAVVLGPIALILVVVWLCLTTGANGRSLFSES